MNEIVLIGSLVTFFLVFILICTNKGIYNPILYLMPYLVFIYLCAIYRTIYGFEDVRITSFILGTTIESRLEVYINYTLAFNYFLLLGFLLQNTPPRKIVKIDSINLDSNITALFNFFCLSLALLNFLYVTNVVSGGVLQYFLHLKLNAQKISEIGLSTIAYNFVYASLIVTIIAYSSGNISRTHLLFVLIIFFLIVLSKARVTQLATDFLLVVIFYLRVSNKTISIKRFLSIFSLLFLVAILTFTFRYISDMYRVGMIEKLSIDETKFIFDLVVAKLLNEGNLPNYASFYAIYHSYGPIIDYRCGETIIAPIFNLFSPLKVLVPESIDFTPTSIEFKQELFPMDPGDGFPPSLFGDFYANGGMLALITFITMLLLFLWLLRYFLLRTSNPIVVFLIVYVITKIIFILPKGEMARFNNVNVLILILPMVCFFLYLFSSRRANDLSYMSRRR
ncbi:hypothetical protein IB294_04005 [Vibrio parahaemolyticus]|uniref:hypothetical protein n=1 Tax=Vibrio parahaemolyticus TaxID=670 RepID=UPI001D168667|nr:hypothetical protein [Vibrio parahaemolyticus]MCC3799630.1 hypothetical protein [Vibrio parahaemolyticus]